MIVYALLDPRSAEVRYVGKTVRSAQRRLRRHMAESYLAADTHKDRWLRSLQREGLEPTIEVLETCRSLDELAAAERRHIAVKRAAGARLTNGTDGGDGAGGWRHSPEAREKIRAALKGRPKSESHRLNSGAAQRGRKATPETRAKMSAERRARGTFPAPRYGADNNKTKLTESDVVEIRRLRGVVSQRALGERFGVSKTAIRHVQLGRNWAGIREFPVVAQ